MDGPRAFEELVARTLESEGYRTRLTGSTHDGSIDVFAEKGEERLAVQAKMYAGGRRVNRRMIFELYGTAAFHGCTGAVLATDGELLPDAEEATAKLGVRVMRFQGGQPVPYSSAERWPGIGPPPLADKDHSLDFETVWREWILPLAGRTLTRADGSANQITAADWAGVSRITSKGRRQHIPIEPFRWAVERVLNTGAVTRDEINQQYEGRASSGIVLILTEVPQFEVGGRPLTIRLRPEKG